MIALEGLGLDWVGICSRAQNIYLCFNPVHIPHSRFQVTRFLFYLHAFFCWWEKSNEFFQFPIIPNCARFIDIISLVTNKIGFIPELHNTSDRFCRFPSRTGCIAHLQLMWGWGWKEVDSWVVLLAKYSYMIWRATGMKMKAGNEGGTVHVRWDSWSLLRPVWTQTLSLCAGCMTCDAGETCVSRS